MVSAGPPLPAERVQPPEAGADGGAPRGAAHRGAASGAQLHARRHRPLR